MAELFSATPRFDWTLEEAQALHQKPFMDLLWEAQNIHRQNHEPGAVQLSQLVSIKTGGCPEDCGYCSQSAKFAKTTGLKATKLMEVEAVISEAKKAKEGGATRYCMGAAWTSPKDRDMETVEAMIAGVKALGLETCATLGMVDEDQASRLKDAGLDYYNHNIDTSERFYSEIITTRKFQDRLDTLAAVRKAGMAVCCGGILGMGEETQDRLAMLVTLAHLEPHPESVPINQLIPIPGTALEGQEGVDSIEFIKTIAIARIMMPKSMVRLSAGRTEMSDEMQALCFMAGANSIFVSGKLLTADNPDASQDSALFAKLGLKAMDLPAA
ncbi:MAG: biotin synthase BioB [Sphingomonadales bacterium]